MEKTFQLPKEFAEKWVKALRSGDYKQGSHYLFQIDNNDLVEYCCLGVAGIVCGVPRSKMENIPVFTKSNEIDNYPEILLETPHSSLSVILATLNDLGHRPEKTCFVKYPNLVFPKIKKTGPYTFNEIADFIELNCEFV